MGIHLILLCTTNVRHKKQVQDSLKHFMRHDSDLKGIFITDSAGDQFAAFQNFQEG